MLTVSNSEAEISYISKLPRDAQGNGWFAIDPQGCKRMSGSNPRTETFHQMQVTVGDSNCSVKGVLLTYHK